MMESKQIKLTKGKFAIVDAEDYERISQYKWRCSNGYASRVHIFNELPLKAEKVLVSMANAVMQLPMDIELDHINRCRLDNRKNNLRPCTRSQNCHNKPPRKGTSSKYKGVSWHKGEKKWRAAIRVNRKQVFLGQFRDEEKAALAYDKKAKELAGEFAYLNLVG